MYNLFLNLFENDFPKPTIKTKQNTEAVVQKPKTFEEVKKDRFNQINNTLLDGVKSFEIY